jgi:hypothetical protein
MLLALIPLLLAAVRIDDATPNGLQGLSHSPAAQSYSLPAAVLLATPTDIMVSPSVMPWANVSPATPLVPASAPAALRQPATAANSNAMPLVTAEVCARGMATTAEIALQSYREKPRKAVSTLVIAASMAGTAAEAQTWPNLNAFAAALNALPYGTPLRSQIRTAGTATLKLCANPNPAPRKAIPGSRVPIARPD